MSVSLMATTPSRPRWDGSRITFEIVEEDQHIICAISRDALQAVSGRRCNKSAELLACFAEARPRIEAIARDKFRERPEYVIGRLNIWADDIEDPPPANDPVAMRRISTPTPR